MTPCKCGGKRRGPGLTCTPCNTAWTKARRAELRKGAPKAKRLPALSETPIDSTRYDRPLTKRRLLIVSAQNATGFHPGFLATLKTAARDLDAEIVAIPFRYRNPTSIWSRKQDHDEWWDPALEPFLFNVRRKLNDNLVLCADIKVQPTASEPLSGFESLTGAESCIIGHPKMQLRSVAAPSNRYPKILTTTGAVTKRNYTDTKAGKLGAFHHFQGGIVVELDGPKRFRLWQINADRITGEFTHLDRHYTALGASNAPPAAGIVLGDSHPRLACPLVDRATFGPGGIVETLRPRRLVWNDGNDNYAVNPHHEGNPMVAAAKHAAGYGSPEGEARFSLQFVIDRTPKGAESVLTPSNHDNMLQRWIFSHDWRKGGAGNARFYLETALAMHRSVRMGPGGAEFVDPFAYWVKRWRGKARVRCLDKDESYSILGNECGMHGDKGPDGARGSVKNLSRLGTKTITGHGHSPAIQEGHYRVGTSTPRRLEYTAGPSSWQNAHCIVYATGKRSLVFIIDGAWRAQIPDSRKA